MKFTAYMSAAALSIVFAAPAFAQTGPEIEFDEIVVTGQVLYADQVNALKTPTPIIDVPQSLSLITNKQILEQGFTSISDIIDYIPGVNNSQGEGHRDSVVFRGVRSTADFFIDGVRDDVQYYRPLYNLEQVEILRGPNALLFGRGGTGGILNRVTKKGEIGEQFTNYQASVDTFGAYSAQIDTNFEVTGDSALRLNGFFENLDNHRDFYDGTNIGFNPTFKVELSPATTLDLSYEYADHERVIDRGIPSGSDGLPVEAFKDIVFGDEELNTTELEAHLWRANVQHDFSENLKANFSAFYGDYDKLYANLYASGYDQELSPNIVELDGYVDTTQRQNFSVSGNLIGQFATGGINHTVVAGGEFLQSQNNNDRFNTFWDQTSDDREFFTIRTPLSVTNGVGVNDSGDATLNDFSVDLNDRTQASVDIVSAYVQDEIELTDMLNLVVGLRFDSFDIDVDNIASPESSGQSSDENISPRLGLVFKPQENMSLYASYSESFLPRSGEQFANINSDDALDANTYSNLEAGVKWDIAPNLSLTAAIFEIEESSPQTADEDAETLDIIDTKTNGVEFQIQGKVTEDWSVSAGYSYLEGNQVDEFGNEGNRKRELPENMFSLWNNYQATERLGLGLGVTYQDESFATNNNEVTLPSYARVDAAAFYDISEDLRVQLNVENLTDEVYYPTAHSTHQITVAEPLNARFTVSGRF